MPARLSLVATLPKLKHVTADEAARRLGITLDELEEANRFALAVFADSDPQFPPTRPTADHVAESRDRIAQADGRATMEGGVRTKEA